MKAKIDFKVNQITTGTVFGTTVLELAERHAVIAQFINDNLNGLFSIKKDGSVKTNILEVPPKQIYNLVIPVDGGMSWTIPFNEIYVHEK